MTLLTGVFQSELPLKIQQRSLGLVKYTSLCKRRFVSFCHGSPINSIAISVKKTPDVSVSHFAILMPEQPRLPEAGNLP